MVAQDTTLFSRRKPGNAEALRPAWEEQIRYWRKQLDGAKAPYLPVDRSASPGTASTATHAFDVPTDLTVRLTRLAHELDASPLHLSVAAFQIVLARYAGDEDVTVVTVADIPSNVVAVRSQVRETTTLRDFVRAVRSSVTAAFAHSDVSF